MKAAPFLLRNLMTAPGLPVTYVLNPRAGSSAVRITLRRALEGPHIPYSDLKNEPFQRFMEASPEEVAEALAKPVFTAVRNPYARALSCYLSKIVTPRNRVRARLGGLPEDPTFEDYLLAVARRPNRDRHWAPQVVNIAGANPLCLKLEEPALSDFLLANVGVPLAVEDKGTYDADGRLAEYLTPAAADLIRKLYAEDFEAFGYPT